MTPSSGPGRPDGNREDAEAPRSATRDDFALMRPRALPAECSGTRTRRDDADMDGGTDARIFRACATRVHTCMHARSHSGEACTRERAHRMHHSDVPHCNDTCHTAATRANTATGPHLMPRGASAREAAQEDILGYGDEQRS